MLAIKDTFHPEINGDKTPIITCDMFDSPEDFKDWCRQHGADGQWIKVTTISAPVIKGG